VVYQIVTCHKIAYHALTQLGTEGTKK